MLPPRSSNWSPLEQPPWLPVQQPTAPAPWPPQHPLITLQQQVGTSQMGPPWPPHEHALLLRMQQQQQQQQQQHEKQQEELRQREVQLQLREQGLQLTLQSQMQQVQQQLQQLQQLQQTQQTLMQKHVEQLVTTQTRSTADATMQQANLVDPARFRSGSPSQLTYFLRGPRGPRVYLTLQKGGGVLLPSTHRG